MLKNAIKTTLHGLAIFCVTPILLSHKLSSALTNEDSSLESHSQLLSLFPGRLGNYLRVGFYRFALDKCDPTATISFGTLFSKRGAVIGKHVYIGPRCILGLVTLEDDVLLGPDVQIPSGPMTHGIKLTNVPIRNQPGTVERITIGTDTWIGAQCTILANVGHQAVVGAGAIVTRNVSNGTIAAGNPAREVKNRFTVGTL
ncbi:acyltransferase [bacterium]|nr:acyltransferase [bacterium]